MNRKTVNAFVKAMRNTNLKEMAEIVSKISNIEGVITINKILDTHLSSTDILIALEDQCNCYESWLNAESFQFKDKKDIKIKYNYDDDLFIITKYYRLSMYMRIKEGILIFYGETTHDIFNSEHLFELPNMEELSVRHRQRSFLVHPHFNITKFISSLSLI